MTITDTLSDPELGYTPFTVERITYTRGRGGTSSRSETFSASGLIHPGTPEMLQLVPEEERKEAFLAVYTDFALSTGDPGSGASFTGADRIHWSGLTWRVVRVRDWSGFGYYQGYAVSMNNEQ